MQSALISIVLVASAIGLFYSLVFIFPEMKTNNKSIEDKIESNEELEVEKEDSLREKVISYGSPILADSLKLIYLIPVYIRNSTFLDEIYEEESWGEFHNPIIYDYKKRTSKKIIDFSFIGDKLSFENISNNNVIAFTGACEDTDGDGQITLLDFNSLYVYSIEDRVLRKVTKENYTVNSFEFVKGQKDILLNINYDKNKDNEIDSNTEPSFIMRYDYSRDKLIPLVDEDFQNDIIKSDKNITMIKRYN